MHIFFESVGVKLIYRSIWEESIQFLPDSFLNQDIKLWYEYRMLTVWVAEVRV